MKKTYITMILLVFVILLSLYYAFFRGNEIEVTVDKSRYIVNEKIRNISLEKIPINLQLEVEKILVDAKQIHFENSWNTDLPFDVTMKPYFDLKYIFLISYDKLIVYNKQTAGIVWKRQFDKPLIYFSLIDGNQILIADSPNHIFTLKRNDGSNLWSKKFDGLNIPKINQNMTPYQISFNEDKRFLSSLLVIPEKNKIHILDNVSGDSLNTFEYEKDISFISDYDSIENSFYVVFSDKLFKLKLQKSNIFTK